MKKGISSGAIGISVIWFIYMVFAFSDKLSDDKGILPDYLKNSRIVLLEGIRSDTSVVFLIMSITNSTFIVLTVKHGVIKLR